MNNYDVIVVGAGNSGLTCALSLLNDGKKVLLLDDHNQIGGASFSKNKGRFVFPYSLHQLYINNTNNEKYKLSSILKRCGATEDIDWSYTNNLYHIIVGNKNIIIPYGTDNFINAIERYVPGSKETVETFIDLAIECREALDYIYKKNDNIDFEYLKTEYNNFVRVSTYTLSQVLDALRIPVAAQEIINALWIYFGSSETELSFITYATFLINLIEYGIKVPTNGNYDIASFIANNFLERGGKIKLNSKIKKIEVENNQVTSLVAEDGTKYTCSKIVINSTIGNVYTKLIASPNIPERAIKAINSHKIGAKVLTINLGLNRTAREIGLEDYLYLIYQSLDSDVLYSSMQDKNHKNIIAYVHNNANRCASPDGTSLISLHAIYFGDCFNNLTPDNYFNEIHVLANNIISSFEKNANVKIKNYIEEIDIQSPIDIAYQTDTPEGTVYGYELSHHDDLLPRLLNRHNEKYISGLEICGGFDSDAYGYASSFMSGIDSAIDIQKESGR